MKHLCNVVCINISDCTKFDPDFFIDTVLVNAQQITHLSMNGCHQFDEYQLVKLLKSLPNLIIVEALKTTGILCVSTSEIIHNCPNIKVLEVVPKFPFIEAPKWIHLQHEFPHVDFGKEIQNIKMHQ